jgi:hypothetical protein
MAADELRPRQVPAPPAGPGNLRPEQLPGPGRPPMKTGKIHMTDHTRKQLEAVGWTEGDPVPGDLGTRLQEIQREVIEERQAAKLEGSELAVGWTPPKTSFVNITDLPPEKQNEIGQYLQEYKKQIAQEEQMAAAVEDADAAIPENIQGPTRDLMRNQILAGDAALTAREVQRQGNRTESTVIDDRETTTKPPGGMQVPEGKTYAGAIGIPSVADKIATLKTKQAAAEPASPEVTATPQAMPTTGVTEPHTANCQRCHWPLQLPFNVEISTQDKQAFLAALLGLSRFEKRYELLGGNLSVIFRSLSSQETEILQQQLGAMVRSGESIGDGEYWANMREFRLVMSVRQIMVGQNVIYTVPDLLTWDTSHPVKEGDKVQPTAIPRMREYFYAEGAKQEPVRRILGQTHSNFQRLVEALEFMTNDPDFWKGIELPA